VKPRKPRGVTRSNAGIRGRAPGHSPDYTPEQTARYKSQALRYSKAVELAVAGPSFVQTGDGIQLSTDVIKGKGQAVFELSDRLLFRYSSDRSPRDYWTVQLEGAQLTIDGAVVVNGNPPAVGSWAFEHPAFSFAATGVREGEPGGMMTLLPSPPVLPTGPAPPGATVRVWEINTTQYNGPTYQYQDGQKVQLFPASTGVFPPFRMFDSPSEAGYDLTIRTVYEESSNTTIYYFDVDPILNNFRSVNGVGPYFPPGDLPPEAIPAQGNSVSFTEYRYFTYSLKLISGTSPSPTDPNPTYTYDPGLPPLPGALAGGEWESNVLTFSESQTVTIAASYVIEFASDVASSVEWQYNGETAGTLQLPGGAAGTYQVEAEIELPADTAVQFFIHLELETHLNNALISLPVGVGGVSLRCDCPDYSRVVGALPRSRWFSEAGDRDWSGSDAGCDVEQGCKHVIATRLHVGLEQQAPTDIPL